MTTTAERYHAFDSLRATMMLLGIVLHAAISYWVFGVSEFWPYQDAATSYVATGLVAFIHGFRMPVFFVMAGFFAGLLVMRYGIRGMLCNRLLRVTLPFALFWIVIGPATDAAAAYANGARTGAGTAALRAWWEAGVFWTNETWHLWFLLHLTVFYLLAALFSPLAARVTGETRAALSHAFMRAVQSRARPVIFAVPTAFAIFLQGGLLDTDRSFTPPPAVLLGYATFFAVGWMLWHHRELLDSLPRFAWTQILLAQLFGPVTAAVGGNPNPPTALVAAAAIAGGLSVWLLVFGIMGLAIKWARRERAWARYLTDASYWMYLVHVPLVLWLPGLLATAPLPALAKLVFVLAVATPVLLLTYHWFVRGTAIGVLLQGRRYPVRFPSFADKGDGMKGTG